MSGRTCGEVRGPAFSVILPVYNGAGVLGRAIQSVMAQTFEDWEIVIVDDGSTDGSWDVVSGAVRQDARVRAFRTPNSGGPARPRNTAITESRGAHVAFLDQDDFWLPEKLEKQLPLLHETQAGVVYGDAWIESEHEPRKVYSEVWGAGSTGGVTEALVRSNFVPALTAVVPSGVARAVGPLDEHLVGVDDYHWWLRIAMAGYRFYRVAEPVAVYTVSDTNLSRDHDVYLRSLDECLRNLAKTHPEWRGAISERRESVRLHAYDYFANRLAAGGLAQEHGIRTAVRTAFLTRNWSEAKRLITAAIPPRFRP